MTDKFSKSSLIEKEKEQIETPDFSDLEKEYLNALKEKLHNTQIERDKAHKEFDGMTLTEYYGQNEEWANTEIQPKKNRSDVTFRSGTLRTKLMAFLSSIIGLNLAPDVSAFNKKEIRLNELGNAMEDVIEKTQELEQDEEKRMLRQYELLKQGTVFIEEIWEEKWIVEKDIKEKFNGKFRGVKWTTVKKKEASKPVKNLIPLTSVYLGDITQYFIENQPYIFTIQKLNYSEAKRIYGKWDMWKYVSKQAKSFSTGSESEWRLINTKKEQVEILKYQDKPNNEYQIILNGIPMLPIGYPLSSVTGHGEYSISQQNLEPIREKFAYGKSFVFKNKNSVALLDEMIKLAVLKTQKSFIPPYFNLSGRVISSRVLMPGKITMGIEKGSLVPASDKEVQGVTASEFSMIQEITRNVDRNTASQTFTGAQEQGGKVTATQIIELQRQAKIMMGIIILSASLMEKKVHSLRLLNILANWFDPIDEVVDQARGVLKKRYRIVSIKRSIDGEGQGLRMVIPTEKLSTAKQLQEVEDKLQDKMGMPVRITTLRPNELKQAKYVWVMNVYPREKKSSELAKLMFREEIMIAMDLGLPLDMSYVTQRFAEVFEEDADKMFQSQQEGGQGGQGTQPPMGATPNQPQSPQRGKTSAKVNMSVGNRKVASEA